MSRTFYSDPKKAQKCVVLLFLLLPLRHFLFPRDFSETTADADIVNTPREPCAFWWLKTETKDLGGIFAAKSIFGYSRAT